MEDDFLEAILRGEVPEELRTHFMSDSPWAGFSVVCGDDGVRGDDSRCVRRIRRVSPGRRKFKRIHGAMTQA